MKTKTPLAHVSKMVIHALTDLKHSGGCSLDSIRKYISENYEATGKPVSEKISMAIKNGVRFGAIKKSKGHYKLDSMMAVVARQGRRRGKTAAPKRRPKRRAKSRRSKRR